MLVLGLFDVSLWILCPTVFLSIICIYTFYKRVSFTRLGYPCARSWPLLGELPSSIKHGMIQHQVIQLRENGKFFGTFSGNQAFLVVADTEMIRQICVKDFNSCPNRAKLFEFPKYLQLSVTNATGEHWRYLRNTVSPTFSTGKLRNMVPLIDKCLDTFVGCVEERLEVSEVVDLHDMFGAMTMDMICNTALGIDVDSQHNPDDPFVKHAKRIVSLSAGSIGVLLIVLFPALSPLLPKLGIKVFDDDAMEFLAAAIREAMVTRRQDGGAGNRDALQLMLNSQAGQDESHSDGEQTERCMTDDEIIANSVAFLLAGYDTTAASMTWAVFCLATNPDVQDRLVAEIQKEVGTGRPAYDNLGRMQYLDMVVSETLRLYPPAVITNRETVQDVEICGYKIPRGQIISIPIYAIHRLEEYWPNPDRFDPERFSPENKAKQNPYTYLPFGVGPRNCVGMRLALMETKMAIVTLLQRFRISPSENTQIPPKFSPSIFAKPANGMPLKLESR